MTGQPKVELNNGVEMPLLGLGTWKAKDAAVSEAVEAALRMGYRHIDTAQMYGNHEAIGKVFGKVFSEGGSFNRKDVWVTSKLANDNHAPKRVAESIRETLAELKLEYLDLFLVHWPVTGNKGPHVEPPLKETWQAMEKLVEEGLVRTIGISNFSVKKIQTLLEYARIPPAVNQIEVHPYMRNDYNIKFCRSKGIHVTAYSPLGSPDSATMMKRSEDAPSLLHEAIVLDVAKQHSKPAAQVLVRWALQHGTSVIPKASSEDHLRSNLDALQWELPEKEYSAVSSIAYQARMVDGSMWLNEEGPYKTLHDLWDGELTGELKEE